MAQAVIKYSDKRTPADHRGDAEWHVGLLYLLGKEFEYGFDKVGDVLYSESGQRVKITEKSKYPYAAGVGIDKDRPSGKVTKDVDEAAKWILRLIPVKDADRIGKLQSADDRYKEAAVILDNGGKRDSTAQSVTGGTLSAVSTAGRMVGSTVKVAVDVGSKIGDSATDMIKGMVSEVWDRFSPTVKGLIAGGVVGGVDYLIRENTTEAVVLGAASGGGMYLYTSGKTAPDKLFQGNLEKSIAGKSGIDSTKGLVEAAKSMKDK